jgi:hypothetical protein
MKSVSRWTVSVFIKIWDGVFAMNWKGTNYVNPCRIVISEKKLLKQIRLAILTLTSLRRPSLSNCFKIHSLLLSHDT